MLAAADPPHRTAYGLDVYLSVVPAEMVRGGRLADHRKAGGEVHPSPEFRILAAVFDVGTRTRVSDAKVTAKVFELALSGVEKTLEPTGIAGDVVYGGFFELPNLEPYTVTLTIERPPARRTVVVDFKYDPRR
jgi:hypothetical protein